MDAVLIDHFTRLLEDICQPSDVRAIEAGGAIDAIWSGFAESGFLDALVAEEAGGAGLALAAILPLLHALGAYAVPLPVAETMAARALLAASGAASPAGPVVLVDGACGGPVAVARTASHALVDTGERLWLVALADLVRGGPIAHGSLAASLSGFASASILAEIERPPGGLRPIAAVLDAAHIAGAGRRALDRTVAYAGERAQFGKPIGKQQAIQQQLAVMAEQVVMATMAAEIGCGAGLDPGIETAAVAKQIASAAAVEIANIAHAVHGAIGISEEFDLQLLTRRLHEWRFANGSEGWWAEALGVARLAHPAPLSVDYIRSIADCRAPRLPQESPR